MTYYKNKTEVTVLLNNIVVLITKEFRMQIGAL